MIPQKNPSFLSPKVYSIISCLYQYDDINILNIFLPSTTSVRCPALWWSTPGIASTCHESGPRRADSHSSRPARPTHRGAEALATASVLWWAAGSRSPVLCLERAPAPTSSGRCGPITRRVMGMAGSRSAGPIGLAHPRSRGSRRGSSGPSQHADASQAVRLPSCRSWPRSSEPPRNLRRRVHSAPPLPLAPSPPMPSRRPLRSLSEPETVLQGFTYVRLSARLCRRYGGASGRAKQGATGWGRGGSGCPHCVRDDYGGQRERSRITRAAVPYCPAPDVSRSVIRCPAGRFAASCVRPLWWTAELSTSRQTPGSTSTIDARRGLTGGLLRSGSRKPPDSPRASSLRSGRP